MDVNSALQFYAFLAFWKMRNYTLIRTSNIRHYFSWCGAHNTVKKFPCFGWRILKTDVILKKFVFLHEIQFWTIISRYIEFYIFSVNYFYSHEKIINYISSALAGFQNFMKRIMKCWNTHQSFFLSSLRYKTIFI